MPVLPNKGQKTALSLTKFALAALRNKILRFERTFDMIDTIGIHFQNVEADIDILPPSLHLKIARDLDIPLLFAAGNRFRRRAVFRAQPRFHFAKNDRLAGQSHDIRFPIRRFIVFFQNLHSLAL